MVEGDSLKALAKRIEDLRAEILFENEATENLPPIAEQHALLAINALEQAAVQLKLAAFHGMQGD